MKKKHFTRAYWRKKLGSTGYKNRLKAGPVAYQGVRVPVEGDHMIEPIWEQLTTGDYETYEITALRNLLQDGDRVLELGAGMGVVSGIAALENPSITVQSYEANPALIPAIAELHALNNITNVQVTNALLTHGDGTGTREFHIAWSFAESSLIAEGARKDAVVQVPEQNVNTTIAGLKPNVLLCDIEGGETELFDGIDLTGIRAVVLELHPHVIGRAAEAAIYDAVLAQGLYPRIELCGGTVVAFERVEK